MENHLDFIVIKAEPKFRADSFALDEADCSAAPVETGIVPVTLSLYACDKRDTAARRAWDNFGVVTEMVPLGLLSGCLLLSQAYDLVELEQFFCSKRFSQFTSLDGRALIERIRGEMNL